MRRFSFRLAALSLVAASALASRGGAQEQPTICEYTLQMKCLDKAKVEGTTIRLPEDATAIRKDGFILCDSSNGYLSAPDIVLIMDNTGSMAKVDVDPSGVAHWCNPTKVDADGTRHYDEPGDPGCISGDPDGLRGPALRTFLDSALVKGGGGISAGVVLFNSIAEAQSQALVPLTSGSIGSLKASIQMYEEGQTNYYAAFRAAQALLRTSKKPKEEQFIIFISDGRPNYPLARDGGPYLYKETGLWDSLPRVHCIFLGNNDNSKDMQDIAAHTKGSFLFISDPEKLASYLTDNLAVELFRTTRPSRTTVRNVSTGRPEIVVGVDAHIRRPDSTWTLSMEGPLYLQKGGNDILIRTEYGTGGKPQQISFTIERASAGTYSPFDKQCRDRSQLALLNSETPPRARGLQDPYLITDPAVVFQLTTAADSPSVTIKTQGGTSAQTDEETVRSGASHRKDSAYVNSAPFSHQQRQKTQGDGRVQANHGEMVTVRYQNPFIPDDSASASARIKYGADVVAADYWDVNGDGRIETVKILYGEDLGAVPDQLRFVIVDDRGQTHERTAAGAEIAFAKDTTGKEDRQRLVVTFKDPFPYGVTSVANAASSGRTFLDEDVPMVPGEFRVDDSVPPVVYKASVVRASGSRLAYVEVVYSEPVTLATPAIEPVIFRRDTVVFTPRQVRVDRAEKVDERTWKFHIAAVSEFSPEGGDYVAVHDNRETADTLGRSPEELTFTKIGGTPPSQSIDGLKVVFANGDRTTKSAGTNVPPQGSGYVPIDSMGYPLPGSSNGKCQSCQAGSEGAFGGSVIVVETRYPVTYTFRIYSNLGELVSTTKGKIEESDLPMLAYRNGVYIQRIVWTGVTNNGQMAGTGAYVLKADFRFERNFRTGGAPSNSTKYTRFGFLRNCCQTHHNEWHQ